MPLVLPADPPFHGSRLPLSSFPRASAGDVKSAVAAPVAVAVAVLLESCVPQPHSVAPAALPWSYRRSVWTIL